MGAEAQQGQRDGHKALQDFSGPVPLVSPFHQGCDSPAAPAAAPPAGNSVHK